VDISSLLEALFHTHKLNNMHKIIFALKFLEVVMVGQKEAQLYSLLEILKNIYRVKDQKLSHQHQPLILHCSSRRQAY
jgi:hypothetical protein